MSSGTVINWIPHGRLCNHLFPLANLLALSRETNCRVLTTGALAEREQFEGTRAGLLPGNPPFLSINVSAKSSRRFAKGFIRTATALKRLRPNWFHEINSDRYFNLGKNGEIQKLLKGQSGPLFLDALYLVHPEALTTHGDFVRSYFTPVKTIRDDIDGLIKKARTNVDVLVGVHIRQTDYATFLGGSLFRDTSFYVQLMHQALELFAPKKVGFLVCSDAFQDRSVFGELDFTFGLGEPVTDLYSLARCDYLISTGSTYAQWASFYGQVPRYLIPPQTEGNESEIPRLSLSDFHVHLYGFGAFSTPDA